MWVWRGLDALRTSDGSVSLTGNTVFDLRWNMQRLDAVCIPYTFVSSPLGPSCVSALGEPFGAEYSHRLVRTQPSDTTYCRLLNLLSRSLSPDQGSPMLSSSAPLPYTLSQLPPHPLTGISSNSTSTSSSEPITPLSIFILSPLYDAYNPPLEQAISSDYPPHSQPIPISKQQRLYDTLCTISQPRSQP